MLCGLFSVSVGLYSKRVSGLGVPSTAEEASESTELGIKLIF